MEEDRLGAGQEPLAQQDDGLSSPKGEGRERQASLERGTTTSQGSGSSMRSVASPSLSPWHGQDGGPMVSSIISNLDLESNDGAAEAALEQHTNHGHTHSLSSSATLTGDSQTFDVYSGTTSRQSTPSNVSTPLAPHDVLSTSPASQRLPDLHSSSSRNATHSLADENSPPQPQSTDLSVVNGINGAGNQSIGEDSALDALLEAHGRQTGTPSAPGRPSFRTRGSTSSHDSASTDSAPHLPNAGDASFGLDPDADTRHAVQGTPFRPLFSSPLRASHTEHTSGHHHSHHDHGSHHSHSRRDWTSSSIYDSPEAPGASHTSAATGAPHTTHSNVPNTETVPTVSATGVPRILPRRTSRSPSPTNSDEKRRQRRQRRRNSSSEDESDGYSSTDSDDSLGAPPPETKPGYAPSGSLTMALFAPGLTWRRRGFLLLASMAINVGLPFLNGVMLGFGEIFARSIVAPWLGLAPAAININAPAAATSTVSTGTASGANGQRSDRVRGNTGSVGLRSGGQR